MFTLSLLVGTAPHVQVPVVFQSEGLPDVPLFELQLALNAFTAVISKRKAAMLMTLFMREFCRF